MHRFRFRKLFIILAVVSVIVALTFAGCRWRRPHERGNSYNRDVYLPSQPGPSKIKMLRVILQGPFVVLVRSELHNRITVYIPQDGDGLHEFRYPGPEMPQTRYKSYHFELLEQGLEINRGRPYVDHGFDDFNEVLTNWPPKQAPANYVILDLPTPDVITYNPPLEDVLFGPQSSPKAGRLPDNHVLEYKVRDGSKVIMRSKELGEQPLTPDCEQGRDGNREPSEGPRISQNLGRPCEQSATYYFGIALSSHDPSMDTKEQKEHAKDFFNEKVLPSMFERPVPEDKKLLRVGEDPYGQIRSMPTMIPTLFRYSQFSGPRMINVGYPGSGGPLCLAPAATGMTVKIAQ